MKRLKTISVLLIFIFFITIIFTSCKNDNLKTIKLVEVTHSVFYAPQYVAITNGYFENEGLKIQLSNGKGADKSMTALLSGQADIGFMGPEASVYVYNQKKNNYAINFAQLTQKDGSFLVGREDDKDFDFSRLKGKTIIGGRIGGMPEMTLEYVLRKHGLEPGKDVTIRNDIQFAMMAGAFIGGEGDYATLFEPVATTMEKENKGYIVASIGKEGGYIPYTCYCATKNYIEENPAVIQGFTNAVYKGMLWVQSHSAEEVAEALVEHFPDTDKDVLIELVNRYKEQETWRPDPVLTEDGLTHMFKIMEQAGQLDKRAPYNKIVNTKFAEQAIKEIELK